MRQQGCCRPVASSGALARPSHSDAWNPSAVSATLEHEIGAPGARADAPEETLLSTQALSPSRATRRRRPRLRRHRVRWIVLLLLVPVLVWLGMSMGFTLTNPAYGSSIGARFAEWARQNHGGGIVNWVENQWYSHHPPPVGGKPAAGAIHRPRTAPTVVASGPDHLAPPAPMTPLASPPIAGEGQWSPAGRTVQGVPTMYVTTLRPDAVHTSEVAGVAWMDTKLLRATLYSGSQIPGPGNYSHTAPVTGTDATTLTAGFNAGFLMSQANGGYYTDGRTVVPLITGAASFVVYKDGTASVVQWGRDATLTPDVASVRQNLDLLVDGGQPVPGLNAADTTKWGLTLGDNVYVWRSGLGVTATGAIVYVGGPGLNITDLANLLADAGAVRGMELDINTDWVNFTSYGPPLGVAASAANGVNLVPKMTGGTGRYFESWWARDFITMSVR